MEYFRNRTGTEELSQANTIYFAIDKKIQEIRTMTLVQVLAVEYDKDGVFGTVDVLPLINKVDFDSVVKPMTPIYNIPFVRLQGNSNSGIILDPAIGDIGLAIISDRDSTAAINTKQQSNPLSNRQNSLSDSFYLGGTLNKTPTQFVKFNQDGIAITSPKNITLTAPDVVINASNSVSITTKTLTVKADNVNITAKTSINGDTSITGETSITGNLTVSGNISGANLSASGDVSDSAGKLSDLRNSYSSHTHPVSGVEAGDSSVTTGKPN